MGRYKHGMTMTPTHRVWLAMRQRCRDRNQASFADYGGRGITVCERWKDTEIGFTNFLADMGPRPSKKHSIDRIDNNGPYAPDNCRWATRTQQNRNSRHCRYIEIDGVTRRITEWARRYGLTYNRISIRIARGWSPKLAVTTPIKRDRRIVIPITPAQRKKLSAQLNQVRKIRTIEINGVTRSLSEWLKQSGIAKVTFYQRVAKGWSERDAVLRPQIRPGTRKCKGK